MELEPSQTVSHYRLIEQIGKGGMGVVWRAMDTTLDREVAIKILPATFANNADRLARFEREAKTLAALNHPNIATIHGLHEDQGVKFLAMELLGGNDLEQVVARGPVPVEQAVEIARHIAGALEEAHRNGVVHRDLKPANVKVTDSQQVKVLDFGLARRADTTAPSSGETVTLTQPGFVVGTAPYMSPEQVRGKTVDKQTDIWALGCVLYEMLTGQRAFAEPTTSDHMAAVLKLDPDYELLPPQTPPALYRLLRRCLEKDARRRWQDVGDVRILLEDIADNLLEQPVVEQQPARTSGIANHLAFRVAPWLIALIAAVAAWRQQRAPLPPGPAPVRMIIQPAAGVKFNSRYATVAVPSPDGSQLVYVGMVDGQRRLYLQRLDELTARALPGTDDGWQPFFSPDGSWVGFFADRKLKKVPLAGAAAETIVEIGGNPRGGSWGSNGWIVVSPSQTSGLIRVDADTGKIEPLTDLNLSLGESTHRWPHVLPTGQGVLFTARVEGTSFDRARIMVDPLDGSGPRVVAAGGAHGRYVDSGHVVFVRGGRLLAVPFDLEQLQATGEPVRLIDGITYNRRNGGAQFAVAQNGTLVYRPGAVSSVEMMPLWIDRTGKTEPLVASRRAYNQPRMSADGRGLLVNIFDGRASALWVLDVQRDSFSQITYEETTGGCWVDPHGKYVVYAAGEASRFSLFLRRTDGLGDVQRLTEAEHRQVPCTVSPDGRYLVFQERRPETGWDLMLLELTSEGAPAGRPRTLLATPDQEEKAHFSRDGQFLAYESDELDAVVQVYTRSFPSMKGKRQMSTSGARLPRFSPTQDELFYWSTGRQQFMAVPYRTDDDELSPGEPQRLLADTQFSAAAGGAGGVIADPSFMGYDVDPATDRFVMLELEKTTVPPHAGEVVVVLNWRPSAE